MNNDSCFKVSILVPIYGVERYIERCVRSLFMQTYQNVEYVFVNDCTPDNSINRLNKVLYEYPNRKEQVRIINHQYNRGVACARNTAINAINGDFVYFVDSDDYLELNTIDVLIREFILTGADIISSNKIINESTKDERYAEPIYRSVHEMLLSILTQPWHHELAGRLVKASLFKDYCIRAIEGQNHSEDWRIVPMIVYYSKKIAVVNENLYHYVINDSSLYHSTKNWEQKKSALLQDYNNYSSLLLFFKEKSELYYNLVYKYSTYKCFNLTLDAVYNYDKKFFYIMRNLLMSYNHNYIKEYSGKKLYYLLRCHNCFWLIRRYLYLSSSLLRK